jgi:hypothetical protein
LNLEPAGNPGRAGSPSPAIAAEGA